MKKLTSIILFCALFQIMASAENNQTDTLQLGRPQSVSPNDLLVGRISGALVTTPKEQGYAFCGGKTDIRGINTIHGSNQPLYIIDGVEVCSDFSRSENPFWNYPGFVPTINNNPLFYLNSYDIKEIKVLKDVSATALYGSKGANGVIIINTTNKNTANDCLHIRSNFGPAFNHHINMNGSRGQAVYNLSLGYSGIKNHLGADREDQGHLKFNYRSHSGKLLWYGVNILGSFGKISNPNAKFNDTDDDAVRYSALASAYLDFHFTDWLTWTTTVGLDLRNQTRYFWYGGGNETGSLYKGLASVSGRQNAGFNIKTEFAFSRYFNSIHHLDIRLGAEYAAENSRMNINNGNDFISYELRAKGINLANSPKQLHNYSNKWGHDDLYLNATYEFRNYFSINGLIRADNTPEFDKGKFMLYPAISLNVNLREMLLPKSDIISTLCLEAGYGRSGKEENTSAGFLTDFVSEVQYPISKEAEPYHDGLFRLATGELNAGVRIGFISDRVLIGLKYYNRNNEDTFNLYSTGAINNGIWNYTERRLIQTRTDKILNAGYEIDFNAEIIRTDAVKWAIDANACYNNNIVTALDNRDSKGHPEITGTFYHGNILGYSASSILGFSIGPDGYYADIVKDGKISDADKIVLGNSIPKWFGGLSTRLNVKNFYFELVASWAAGFSAVNTDLMIDEGRTMLTGRYIYPASYFSLQRAAARYDIPLKNRKILKNLSVEISYGNVIINNMTSVGVGLKF